MQVDQRVESAVQTHEAVAQLPSNVDSIEPFVTDLLFGQNSRQEVEVLEYVEGDVTDGEEKNQNEQQPQASLFQYLVSGVCAAETENHMSVAAHCNEERDTKASEGPSKAVFQVILNFSIAGGIVTLCSFPYRCFGVKHVRKTLNTHQHPNQD